jgi:tRNA(Ile)-lysidine synthase
MQKLNPFLEATFEKNIAYFSEIESFLAEIVAQHRQRLFIFKDNRIEILIAELTKLQAQELLLFELFRPFGFNKTTIKDLIKSLSAESGRQFHSESHSLFVDRVMIILEKKEQEKFIAQKIDFNQTKIMFWGNIITIKELINKPETLKTTPNICYADADQFVFPLELRTWQEGDVFKPFGLNGEKKLSDFLISQKYSVIF